MRQRTWWLAGCLMLGACGSEGTGPTPPPPPPAEPTGTFLLRDPGGILYTLEAGADTPVEISRFNFPFVGTESTLLPDGKTVVGMGSARDGFPRGLRWLDLGNGGELTTLIVLEDVNSYVFDSQASPDGAVLALAAAGWVPGRISLMRMDLTTRVVEQLWINTEDATEFARFSWLPDGSGLVGQLWGLNRFRMARFDMATRSMTVLSDWMTGDSVLPTMRLSRDGSTIAFNTQDGVLRFITLDGAPAPGFPTDLHGVHPAFSPDGQLLAYSRLPDGLNAPVDGVWIYRFSDGATWRLLPEGSRLVEVLDWE